MSHSNHAVVTADGLDITIKDMSFYYKEGKPIIESVNASIPQGSLVSIEGYNESGKATFTRLLAQSLLPCSGEVFIPQHLRVLRVHQEPFILNASAFENKWACYNGPSRT